MAVAAWTVAGGALFLCFLRLSETVPVNSDGASNALQAWDMLHGNLLLRGWHLSDVSFYTTELPQYMLVELVFGLKPGVVHVAGAMTYTFLVLLAALLGQGRARGPAGVIRAAIAAGIMLAPQLGDGAYLLLLSPDHVGSAVPVLLAWVILDRARPRWYRPVAVGALLSWALVADPLVLYIAILPLALACAGRVYRGAVVQRQPWAAQRPALTLAAAALAPIGAAWLLLAAVHAGGGYQVEPVGGYFTSAAALPGHVWTGLEALLLLFGADFLGQPMGLRAGLALLHLAGAALAAWAVAAGLRSLLRGRDLVPDLLVLAVLSNLAGFLLSTRVFDARSAREMAAVLPFGAVLAARLLGARLAAARLLPLLLVIFLGYAAALGYEMTWPRAAAQDQQLAGWLAAHHLRHGLGAYWLASGSTLASGNRVQVRPVCAVAGRLGPELLRAEQWESKASWYDPQHTYANFLVLGQPAFCNKATAREARSAFGPPARSYHVGGYTVLVWDKNLLAMLG